MTRSGNRSYEYFFVIDAKVGLIEHTTALRLRVVLLGEEDCDQSIRAVSTEKVTQIFPSIPNYNVRLSVDDSVTPKRNCRYCIPLALEESTQRQLDELERAGIIEEAPGDSPWMSPLRTVEKPPANEKERLARSTMPPEEVQRRLVVDLREVNKAVKRYNHPMPVLESMSTKLCGAKFFSKLDLEKAFYHVMLHPDSRYLTSFMTAKGPRQFTRLPFGINCAPELFQSIMEDILRECSHKIVFMDDTLLWGATKEELQERTRFALQKLKENNLTINLKKCEFDKEEIDFLGFTITKDGIRPTQSKIDAIQNFRRPKERKEVKSFLGLVTFISGSLERLAEKTALLRELTRKDVTFHWTEDCERESSNS